MGDSGISTQKVRPAGFWLRAIAGAIDLSLVVGVVWLISLVVVRTRDPVDAQDDVVILYLIISASYSLAFWLKCGATPGKLALGLRVVRARDLQPVTVFQAALRWMGYGLSLFLFGAGYLMAAFQPRKQAIHDLIAGTRVIRQGRA